MTLDELITALEAEDPDRVLPFGFTHPHSYRGIDTDLAFEPVTGITIGEMLYDARRSKGATFERWKGGHHIVQGYDDCWLAEEGHGGGEMIGPILLALILASDQFDEATLAKLAGFETEWARQYRRESDG